MKKDYRKIGGKCTLSWEEKFWEKVEKSESCWRWTGSVSKRGYGLCKIRGFNLAHRLSYFIYYGIIPDDKPCICHSCDNPICVNPDHLFAGTVKDNMDDMHKKGRHNNHLKEYTRGSSVFGAKLTEGKVFQLRRIRLKGCGVKRMADWLGMDRTSVQDLLHGRTWKHVPFPKSESDVFSK